MTALPDSPAALQFKRAGLGGLAQTLSRGKVTLFDMLGRIGDQSLTEKTQAIFDTAAATAGNAVMAPDARTRAIELLAFAPTQRERLTSLAQDDPSQAIRLAALGALSRSPEFEPWPAILKRFPSETPAVRSAILAAVVSRPNRINALLDEIAAGAIKTGELDQSPRQPTAAQPRP